MSDFISTYDLEAYLRLPSGALLGDLAAELACDAAESDLKLLLAQDLLPVVNDLVMLDGDGTDALILPQCPVVSPATVTIEVNEHAVDTRDYWVDAVKGIIFTRSRFFSRIDLSTGSFVNAPLVKWIPGRRIYAVTYSHGFAPADYVPGSGDPEFPELPATIKRLMVTLAARIYDQGLAKQETTGGYTVTYSAPDAMLTKSELNLVARLRRPQR